MHVHEWMLLLICLLLVLLHLVLLPHLRSFLVPLLLLLLMLHMHARHPCVVLFRPRLVVRVPGGSCVPKVGSPDRPMIRTLIPKGQGLILGRLEGYGGQLRVPVQGGVPGHCLRQEGHRGQ